MKSFLVVSALMVASLLYSTVIFSADKTTGVPDSNSQFKDYQGNIQKDQCLIVAKNCVGGDDSVLKRVERLNNEISKGAAVYTPEELQNLQDQLNWIYYESEDFPAVSM
jgi:hypothetical protein